MPFGGQRPICEVTPTKDCKQWDFNFSGCVTVSCTSQGSRSWRHMYMSSVELLPLDQRVAEFYGTLRLISMHFDILHQKFFVTGGTSIINWRLMQCRIKKPLGHGRIVFSPPDKKIIHVGLNFFGIWGFFERRPSVERRLWPCCSCINQPLDYCIFINY